MDSSEENSSSESSTSGAMGIGVTRPQSTGILEAHLKSLQAAPNLAIQVLVRSTEYSTEIDILQLVRLAPCQ